MKANTSRSRWIWVVAGLAAIVFVAVIVMGMIRSKATAAPSEGEIVTAIVGDLSANATASGRVQTQRSARLSLATPGKIAQVLVETGDTVRAGDTLLQLETTTLASTQSSARQNVTIQESNLATLMAPPLAEDRAAARASVASAQAQLDRLLAGPDPDMVAASRASLRAAEANVTGAYARLNALQANASPEEIQAAELALAQAQADATQAAEAHSTILVTEPNQWLSQEKIDSLELGARAQAVQANAALASAQAQLDALLAGDPNVIAAGQANLALAVANRDASQAQLDVLLAGPSPAEIAAARASLAQAQAGLDALLRGPDENQIAIAQAQLVQAQTNLARAEHALAETTLTAPFDGLVTAVYVYPGEQANGVLIELVDMESLEIELEVDEVDLASLRVGQPAVVTLESRPNDPLEATVISVAPEASESSMVTTFRVNLALVESDSSRDTILVGMTANANLTTEKREQVLLVPNRAITTDREANLYSVTRVLADGSEETVQVSIGLRDDRYAEITSGLNAGDQLLIKPIVQQETFMFGGRQGPASR